MKFTAMNWFDFSATRWSVLLVSMLNACDSHGSATAVTGTKLNYIGTSDSVATFSLHNSDTTTLKINGSGDSKRGVDVYLGQYSLSCKRGNSSDEDPDGTSDPPEFTEIRPGATLTLRVHTKLTHQYKNGRCQLWLTSF